MVPLTVAVGVQPGGYATSASQVSLEMSDQFDRRLQGLASLQGVIDIVVARHHVLTAHFIKFVPAHSSSAVRRVRVGADTETELIVVDVHLVNG